MRKCVSGISGTEKRLYLRSGSKKSAIAVKRCCFYKYACSPGRVKETDRPTRDVWAEQLEAAVPERWPVRAAAP
jgi:hypothetical protein